MSARFPAFSTRVTLLHFVLLVILLPLPHRSTIAIVDAAASPIHLDLELQHPRPAAPDSHRGFPSHVTVYEPTAEPSLTRLHRRLRRTIGLSEPPVPPFSTRTVSVDLLGGITKVGEYYTRVFIGGQPVRVQIDTGSSTLALPVAECDRCLPSDQRYNPKLSTSRHQRWISCTNPLCRPDVCSSHRCKRCSAKDACCAEENPAVCAFSLKYGDGSGARGGLMVDEMKWGNVSAPVVFGAILHDSADFERSLVDGILGMAYRALACNPSCVEPPFQQMVKAKVVEDTFSICITPSGGKLILGDFDTHLAKSPLTYVPLALSDPPTFYTVNMTNIITIGGRDVSIPNFRAGIVDSGTTLIVVSVTTFRLILLQLTQFHCDVPGLCHTEKPWFLPTRCVKLPDEVLNKMPKLTFHLGSGGAVFKLELRPEDYMLRMSDPRKRGYRCVGFMVSKSMSKTTDVIFGNTIMMRYVSHYDRKNKRMGFAEAAPGCGGEADCGSYTQCRECAKASTCRWNFASRRCMGGASRVGVVPYPDCAGAQCMCGLGAVSGVVFGLGAGAAGGLLVVGVATLVIVLYSRRESATTVPRQDDEWFEMGAEDDDGIIEPEDGHFQGEKRYIPVPSE